MMHIGQETISSDYLSYCILHLLLIASSEIEKLLLLKTGNLYSKIEQIYTKT